METNEIKSLSELSTLAKEVLSSAHPEDRAFVIALSGDLGAGKTAFVKELAKLLGVSEEVTSPTFVIMRSYETKRGGAYDTLTHIDAYRIESDDEMRVLGFEEMLNNKGRIVCIEWPEKIQRLIPADAYPVALTIKEGDTRIITYGT